MSGREVEKLSTTQVIQVHNLNQSQAGALEIVAFNLASVTFRGNPSLDSQPQTEEASRSGSDGGGGSCSGASGGDSEGRLKVYTWFLSSLTASHLSTAARSAIADSPDVLRNLLLMLDCHTAPQCGMQCNLVFIM